MILETISSVVIIVSTVIGSIVQAIQGESARHKNYNEAVYNQAVQIVNSLRGDVTTWRDQVSRGIATAVSDLTGTHVKYNKLNEYFDKELSKIEKKLITVKENSFYGKDYNQTIEAQQEAEKLAENYKQWLGQIKEEDRMSRERPMTEAINRVNNMKAQRGEAQVTDPVQQLNKRGN